VQRGKTPGGPPKRLVRRGLLSPAVIVAWGHCALVFGFVFFTGAGRAGLWVVDVVPLLAAPVIGGVGLMVLLDAWMITRRQVAGYVWFLATIGVEIAVWRTFDSHPLSAPWRLDGLLYAIATGTVCAAELVWLAATGRVTTT
jgi:hypothetical protein